MVSQVRDGIFDVVLEPQAVGCQEGWTEFHMYLGHQGSFSSIRSPAEDVTSRSELIEVPVTTLDAYVRDNRLPRVDFIKIDVEGGELNVLKGGSGVLETHRPVVMGEVEDRRTKQWGYRAREILDYLVERGYEWLATTARGTLIHVGPEDEYAWQNLVGVPADRMELVGPMMES